MIDSKIFNFGCDARNLRLGLSSNEMNSYDNMSSTHSTWPIILTIYNLPPRLCMKHKFMMLSLLISGLRQPRNDIDVYLAPLIEDLKIMWEKCVAVFDAYLKKISIFELYHFGQSMIFQHIKIIRVV